MPDQDGRNPRFGATHRPPDGARSGGDRRRRCRRRRHRGAAQRVARFGRHAAGDRAGVRRPSAGACRGTTQRDDVPRTRLLRCDGTRSSYRIGAVPCGARRGGTGRRLQWGRVRGGAVCRRRTVVAPQPERGAIRRLRPDRHRRGVRRHGRSGSHPEAVRGTDAPCARACIQSLRRELPEQRRRFAGSSHDPGLGRRGRSSVARSLPCMASPGRRTSSTGTTAIGISTDAIPWTPRPSARAWGRSGSCSARCSRSIRAAA